MTSRRDRPWLIPSLLMLLGSTALLSAVVRVVVVAGHASQAALPSEPHDAQYVQHMALIFAHLLPGIAFMILGPLQMSNALRARWPRVHKACGYVFVVATLLIGVTALWMNQTFIPVGGAPKYVANVLWGLGMLIAVVVAVVAALRRRIATHRAWMIRAYAYGLGVATQRVVMLPILAVVGFENLTADVIDAGVWLGWLVNTVAAELIIRRRLPRVAPLSG